MVGSYGINKEGSDGVKIGLCTPLCDLLSYMTLTSFVGFTY